MIQIADLRTFKKFQQTFGMKCSFRKFAVYQSVTLGKLYFVADDFLSILRNFSEHLLLRKIMENCCCQGTVCEKLSFLSVPVKEFTGKVD